jgi:mRNA-degrading endonuclease YafQ of YafQ-DinJ toxin-antitoxin module
MRQIKTTAFFEKKAKLFLKRHPDLETRFNKALIFLQKDPFHSTLYTHKLSGKLSRLYACSINYEYRLIFLINENTIYLHGIGSHDEVY